MEICLIQMATTDEEPLIPKTVLSGTDKVDIWW